MSKNRKTKSAKHFFPKTLASCHTSKPRVLTVDKKTAYPKALKQSKKSGNLPSGIQSRQVKYLNNMIEQEHRFIKKRIRYMLKFQFFQTTSTTLAGIESMHMIKKEQTFQGEKSVRNQIRLIHNLFSLTSQQLISNEIWHLLFIFDYLCTRTTFRIVGMCFKQTFIYCLILTNKREV